MNTPLFKDAIEDAIRSACPKRVRVVAHRVTLCERAAERGVVRVHLDGNLIGEWGYSDALDAWMQRESAARLGPDGRAVYRAVCKVLAR